MGTGDTVDHLFIHCSEAFKLQSFIFGPFGIQWVLLEKVLDLLCGYHWRRFFIYYVGRLRPTLSKLIDPALVAFIPSRSIIENILLSQKIVHALTYHLTKCAAWTC